MLFTNYFSESKKPLVQDGEESVLGTRGYLLIGNTESQWGNF